MMQQPMLISSLLIHAERHHGERKSSRAGSRVTSIATHIATWPREDLLAFYEGKVAKWWTPDDVVVVDAIPLGATGKMLKNRLRETFKDYLLPTA
jgi:acyl-CoA synthetase (AMP-forming)/AMP-acid ligase II